MISDDAGAAIIRTVYIDRATSRDPRLQARALMTPNYLPYFRNAWRLCRKVGVPAPTWVSSLFEVWTRERCLRSFSRPWPPPSMLASRRHVDRIREWLQDEGTEGTPRVHATIAAEAGLRASAPLANHAPAGDRAWFWSVLVDGEQLSPWWVLVGGLPPDLEENVHLLSPTTLDRLEATASELRSLTPARVRSLEALKRKLTRPVVGRRR